MNKAVLNTAVLGVARLGCADLGDFMGCGSGSGGGASLPKEYQQVEYIEGTGTQYIKTAIKTSLTLDFVCEFSKSNSDITFLFGGRTNQNTNGVLFGFNGSNCNVAYGKQTNMYSVTKNVIDGKKHIVELSDSVYSIDGEEQYMANRGNTLSDNCYVYLFALNNNGTTNTRIYIGKVFSFLIKEFGVVQCYFIPCYRKADNEIGMYDIVNDVFYTNSGTGTFLKGANVNDKTYSKPYIKGHITTNDSTFTFTVDGNSKTVPVNGNGDFKLKLNNPITSLSFVGVPQLESLELFKIDGVTTFDVDYPTNVTFLRCDSTTNNAKNDVYHIRGTATGDFSFMLRYIADGTGTSTLTTENAVIDENGNWDVSYSGKKIGGNDDAFKLKTTITSIEFTEDFTKCTKMYGWFTDSLNIVSIDFPNARFTSLTSMGFLLNRATSVQRLNIPLATFDSLTNTLGMFNNANSLNNFIISANNIIYSDLNVSNCPLSYESMLNIAGWLKDLTGQERKTVTFKQSAYNKPLTPEEESTLTPEQQSALIAERQANLLGIIEDTKNWILQTA